MGGWPGRVLMTADTLGGVFTYAVELARGLAERGTAVTLATMGEMPSAAQRATAATVPGLELAPSAFALEWMEAPWREVDLAGAWLLGLEEERRPDLVHLNGYAHAGLPFRAPKLVVAHSCVLSWFEAVRGAPAPEPEWSEYRRRVAEGIARADLVVAPTRAMLDEVERWYGAPRSSRVVPNGHSPEAFGPSADEPIVLSVGRLWDEAKNVGALARAAPRLSWPVHLVGPRRGPGGPSEVGWSGVTMHEPMALDELASWYGRAGIYALPARYEPFGLTVLEAALSGCALVLGRIRSLVELWSGAASFVEPDDEEELVSAVEELARNPRLRMERGRRARERGLRYGADAMVGRYLEAYGELLEPSPPPPGQPRPSPRPRAEREDSP